MGWTWVPMGSAMFEKLGKAIDWPAFGSPAGAEAMGEPSVVWELRAMEVEFWGRSRRQPVVGALPAGFLVLSPQGRFASAIGGGAPESPADRENEASFRAAFPATGEYRIEGGRLITRAAHADEAETVLARDCSLEGNWLEVATTWLVGNRESSEIRRVVFGFRRMP